jgi:hypothetical protein
VPHTVISSRTSSTQPCALPGSLRTYLKTGNPLSELSTCYFFTPIGSIIVLIIMSSLYQHNKLSLQPTTAAYRYQRLNSGVHEIRLLRVLSTGGEALRKHRHNKGHDPTMFRCQLVHAQLEQSPAFSALSYVWGDPELKNNILVTDHY